MKAASLREPAVASWRNQTVDKPEEHTTDTELFRRARQISPQAETPYRILYDRLKRRMAKYAIQILGPDPEKVDDALQSAFAEIWKRRDDFPEGRRLRPWVFRILKSVSMDQLRKRRPVLSLDRPDEDPAPQAASTDAGPATKVRRKETEERLRQAVRELPDREREAIELHFFAELSVPEVAQLLGVSEFTVRARLNQATDQLRTLLGADQTEED